jgi:hypothetical protein
MTLVPMETEAGLDETFASWNATIGTGASTKAISVVRERGAVRVKTADGHEFLYYVDRRGWRARGGRPPRERRSPTRGTTSPNDLLL